MYSQDAHSEISFIGKQENLAEDLIFFLTQQGYRIKDEKIKKSPKQNVSETQEIKWDPHLKEDVKDSEKMVLSDMTTFSSNSFMNTAAYLLYKSINH